MGKRSRCEVLAAGAPEEGVRTWPPLLTHIPAWALPKPGRRRVV